MVYFKLPFQPQIYTTDTRSKSESVSFHSFDEKIKIVFQGDLVMVDENEFYINHEASSTEKLYKEETKEEYIQNLERVTEFIRENTLQKLVYSRRKIHPYLGSINYTKTFQNLVQAYPNALVYFFENEGNCWMGAFSEVLGKYSKIDASFHTMSLAGTLPIDKDWSVKEIEEQKPVTEYIESVLQRYDPHVKISETYDHFSGRIKHLRNDFAAKIPREKLELLIKELHPTPAVCGIPKKLCLEALEKFEKYPREFYAGYHRIETSDEIYYFVNLRCGKIFAEQVHVFVGGGITKDSLPEKEWIETELKAEALLQNIVIL